MDNKQAIDILFDEYKSEYKRVLPDDMRYTVPHEEKLEAYRRALASLALIDDTLTDTGIKFMKGKTDDYTHSD